jgi:hypothetical protein
MKPLSRSASAVQNEQAIETRRLVPSIVNRELELNLKSLDSLYSPTGVSQSKANVPTEQSDYSRLTAVILWVMIAVLVVVSCDAFYALWSKVSGS